MKQSLSIYDRIDKVCKMHCINESDFCRSLNVQLSTYLTMMTKHSRVSYDLLHAILEKYDDISTDWLVMGRGMMVKTSSTDASSESSTSTQSTTIPPLPLPDDLTPEQQLHTLKDLHQRNYILQRELVQLTYTNQQLVETNGHLIRKLLAIEPPLPKH